MEKILVTGASGQLGRSLMAELERRGIAAVGLTSAQLDVSSEEQVQQVLARENYSAVAHLAAYTAVDQAEAEQERCRLVNALGTRYVASACAQRQIKMLYVSSDYVFGGGGQRAWEIEDVKQPLNVYGQTKYEGELAVQDLLTRFFIVRISWVFGPQGKNFPATILRLGGQKKQISIVDDQIGAPTYTVDAARLLTDILLTERYGTYHASNEGGDISWFDFACEILRQAGFAQVQPQAIRTVDYPTAAKRPLNSRLSKASLDAGGFMRLPPWQDALGRFLKQMKSEAS